LARLTLTRTTGASPPARRRIARTSSAAKKETLEQIQKQDQNPAVDEAGPDEEQVLQALYGQMNAEGIYDAEGEEVEEEDEDDVDGTHDGESEQ
jgi:hypothetical protein